MSYLVRGDADKVFAVPLSMQYTLLDTSTGFSVNIYDEDTPLNTLEGQDYAPSSFDSDSFDEFYQYPASGESIKVTPTGGTQNRQRFATPFSEGVTVTDVAAASSSDSSSGYIVSGLAPTIMSQYASVTTYDMSSSDADITYDVFDKVYQDNIFDNLATCSHVR